MGLDPGSSQRVPDIPGHRIAVCGGNRGTAAIGGCRGGSGPAGILEHIACRWRGGEGVGGGRTSPGYITTAGLRLGTSRSNPRRRRQGEERASKVLGASVNGTAGDIAADDVSPGLDGGCLGHIDRDVACAAGRPSHDPGSRDHGGAHAGPDNGGRVGRGGSGTVDGGNIGIAGVVGDLGDGAVAYRRRTRDRCRCAHICIYCAGGGVNRAGGLGTQTGTPLVR